jgi:hypothetical protein
MSLQGDQLWSPAKEDSKDKGFLAKDLPKKRPATGVDGIVNKK